MAFDVSALSLFINEQIENIWSTSMYSNDSAPYLNQIQNVKATNALPTIEHEKNVLVDASAELTSSDFDGDVDISQVNLVTDKVAYWNKFRVDELENYFTQKYLPAGANYDLGQTEAVLAAMLMTSNEYGISAVINRQVELLTWQGDKSGSAPFNRTDGLNKQTAAVNTTSNGVVTSSNARTYIDGLVDAAAGDADWSATLARVGGSYIMCGHDVVRNYAKQYRTDFTSLPYNEEFGKPMVDGTGVMIIPCSGLTGTNDIYLVKNDNFTQGSDLRTDQDRIEFGMDQFQEYVWVKCKFRLGFIARSLSAQNILVHREDAVS